GQRNRQNLSPCVYSSESIDQLHHFLPPAPFTNRSQSAIPLRGITAKCYGDYVREPRKEADCSVLLITFRPAVGVIAM
ncbi:hypothetical protein KAH43_06080, partial [Candidatus Bipolaricaulota bacterium]|nr:hypothetical protein [Candidatus Bipolaricaulota bacterium]